VPTHLASRSPPTSTMDKNEASGQAVELLCASVGIPRPGRNGALVPFSSRAAKAAKTVVIDRHPAGCAPRLVMATRPILTGSTVTVRPADPRPPGRAPGRAATCRHPGDHDLGVVPPASRDIIVMYAGRIVERAPTRTCSATPRCPHPGPHGLHPRLAIPDSGARLGRHRPVGPRPDPPARRCRCPPAPVRPGQVPGCRSRRCVPWARRPPVRLWFPLVDGVSTAPPVKGGHRAAGASAAPSTTAEPEASA